MPFDPATLPQLTSLGQRLQQLAGDAAYKAGRDYLRARQGWFGRAECR